MFKSLYTVGLLLAASVGLVMPSTPAEAWALVDGPVLPNGNCNVFKEASRVFTTWNGYLSGYELLVSADGSKLDSTPVSDPKILDFITDIDGVAGKYTYRRVFPKLDNSLYYPFGSSIRLISTDQTLQLDPPSITIAKPFSWQSQAGFSLGIGSAVMRSAKYPTGAPMELTTQIFTDAGTEWRLVYSETATPSSLGNTQFSSDVANEFASASGTDIKIYDVSPNGLTIKQDILTSGTVQNGLAVNSKFVASEERDNNGHMNLVIYSLKDGFPLFSALESALSILPNGQFRFVDDVLIASAPNAPGPDGGYYKGGIQVIVPFNDGYSWQTAYTYNGTNATRANARIGTCTLGLSASRILFAEFVSDNAVQWHLISDGGVYPMAEPPVQEDRARIGNIAPVNVQLLEPHPKYNHTEPNSKAFYYMWTDDPSNDVYVFHDIYPDTTTIHRCNPKAIASGPSNNTYNILRSNYCFSGVCYFMGFTGWTRDCNGSAYRQSWEVTPVAGGTAGQSTGLYTFDR